MAPPASYLAVLKAAYDYTPDSKDEIAIKEDQILFLIERTDDEYVPPRAISTIHDLHYPCYSVGGGSKPKMPTSLMKGV